MTRLISIFVLVVVLVGGCVFVQQTPFALSDVSQAPPPKSIAPERNDEAELSGRRKQPFVVYTRDYTTPCFADYVPTPQEVQGRLMIEMAANEYEPVQIGVYVPSAANAVSDLSIDVDIDIPYASGYLHYDTKGQLWRPVDEGQWYADYPGGRRAMPLYLVPGDTIRQIAPGRSSAFWITFKAGANVSAGVHTGRITISAQAVTPKVIPITVEVYRFALPRPQAVFSFYYRIERLGGADVPVDQTPPYRTKAYQQMYADDMAAHGHNSVQIKGFHGLFGTDSYQDIGQAPIPPVWQTYAEYGGWRQALELLAPQEYADGYVDPARLLEEQMRMYQRAGLVHVDIPMHAGGNFACDRKPFVADTMRSLTIKNDWPEFLLYMRDEPPVWDAPQEQMAQVFEFKRVARARGLAALGGVSSTAWGHLHDVWNVLGGEVTPEMLREARRQGGQIWTYSDARLRVTNPLINRYYSGLYTWGLGLAGNHTYCYQHGDVGSPHPVWLPDRAEASRPQIMGFIIPGPSGPVPGVGYEGRREGIDDYRYLQLLQARVAAAGPGNTVAKAASRWLANLKQRVETAAVRGLFGTGCQYLWELDWVNPQPDIDPLEYDDIRRTAVRYISQLPPAAGEANPPPTTGARQFPLSGWEGEPFHSRSLDECLRALQHGDVTDKRAAANALLVKDVDALDPGRLALWIETLAGLLEQPDVRIPTLRALRVFGPQAAPALSALKRQLTAQDPWVRCGALLTMESMGAVALDGLIQGLEDPFPMNSVLAAQCLSRIGPDAARAIPALKKALATAILRGHKRHLQGAIDTINPPTP